MRSNHTLISDSDARSLKRDILASGLSIPELVRTAWAAASSYRDSDMRGGADGGRLRLEPQRSWKVNDPKELAKVLAVLEGIQREFNDAPLERSHVSMADLIVLGGAAAIEKAAADAGVSITVPFTPGYADATQADTDIASFAFLEPTADGFRNYYDAASYLPPAQMLVDKADQLDLSVPEMTVLVGGMRALGATSGGTTHGQLSAHVGRLDNAFFVNLLDMSTQWKPGSTDGIYEGIDRSSGKLKWTATPVDLIFGANAELRAVAEVYASDDAKEQFIRDFVAAWAKVMNHGRGV